METADDGTVAVEKMKKAEPGQYDLVLMDGYEATRHIRELENDEISNIPIVAMTANAFSSDQEKAMSCGMDGYLTKPINVKAMLKVMNEIFD